MGNEKKKKKTGEPQRYSWGTRRRRRRQVNPPEIYLGNEKTKKNGEP